MNGTSSTIDIEDQEVRRVIEAIIRYAKFLDSEIKVIERTKSNKKQGLTASETMTLFFPINTYLQGIADE